MSGRVTTEREDPCRPEVNFPPSLSARNCRLMIFERRLRNSRMIPPVRFLGNGLNPLEDLRPDVVSPLRFACNPADVIYSSSTRNASDVSRSWIPDRRFRLVSRPQNVSRGFNCRSAFKCHPAWTLDFPRPLVFFRKSSLTGKASSALLVARKDA